MSSQEGNNGTSVTAKSLKIILSTSPPPGLEPRFLDLQPLHCSYTTPVSLSSRTFPMDSSRRAVSDPLGSEKQTEGRSCCRKWSSAQVAAPRAHVAPASKVHSPGFPGWVLLPWEGTLSISQLFQSLGPFTSCFPASLLSFSAYTPPGSWWTRVAPESSCWGGGGAAPHTLPSLLETIGSPEVLNTQFNLKQAQVQTIHKSF